jgi:anti-sigma factor (TIGR02949 family)
MTPTDAYRCREAFARLEDYVDRELPADELDKVDEHLRICETCAGEFAFEERVLDTMREKLKRIDVPAGLQERLLRLIAKESD